MDCHCLAQRIALLFAWGSIGQSYVDQLTEEVRCLCNGTYLAERILIFSSVILQKDRSVGKGCDIRRLLDCCLTSWLDSQFDVLLQEAQHYDRSLCNLYHSSAPHSDDHLAKVFTKLMLQGKIRAAIRWITERAGGSLLSPSESVATVLQSKHPDSLNFPETAIPSFDDLPSLENSEITAANVQFIAYHIQGGADPGVCQSAHWRDALLQHGSSNGRLREVVAALCRLLCNSIVPWSAIRALLASRLIALDKCPGVCPVGVGKTLQRIVGKTICLVTCSDASLIKWNGPVVCRPAEWN